eukprot:s49_g11.t1
MLAPWFPMFTARSSTAASTSTQQTRSRPTESSGYSMRDFPWPSSWSKQEELPRADFSKASFRDFWTSCPSLSTRSAQWLSDATEMSRLCSTNTKLWDSLKGRDAGWQMDRSSSPNRIGNAPDRKAASLSVWSRADEAAMASRLDATVGQHEHENKSISNISNKYVRRFAMRLPLIGPVSFRVFAGALLTLLARRERKEAAPADAPPAVQEALAKKASLGSTVFGLEVMAMVYLGDQLGLYKTLSSERPGRGPGWTASRLAKAAGNLSPRLAAAGLVDFDETAQNLGDMTFSLPAHGALLLAENLGGSFMAPYATLMLACYKRLPSMMQAFRGGCLAPTYDEAGEDLADAMARLHVPEVKFFFIPKVIPEVQNGALLKRLQEGAICADLGCSGADTDCTLELAQAFPKSKFYAYEVAEPALERARDNIKHLGITNVIVVDAKVQPLGSGPPDGGKFDFVMCYDVLHDLAEPEKMIQEVRDALHPDGVWVVVDIASEGLHIPRDAKANIKKHPGAAAYYGISVCLCLPSGLSVEGGRGLGTLGFPVDVAEPMFRSNGFSKVRNFRMPTLEKNQVYEVAQTPSGAALLAERRIFQLLAFCPLLREFVLSNESSYVVPANSIDGTPLVMAEKQRRNLLAAWRRPAHSSWCRVLLLVATILSSVSAPSGAEHFLQVYRERFCFVFQTNLQSGRLAALEEATLMARVLAFLSNSCSLAQSLATDASLRAMIFIMASCLTERSSPSEVFLPISAEERAAALVQQVAVDGDSTSAQARQSGRRKKESLLLALLRISSSPQWALGRASQVTGSVALPPPAPGWPTAYQSVFGLKNAGGNAALGSETDVLRFWAALMDVVLEAGRKALEVLETLRGTRQEPDLSITE